MTTTWKARPTIYAGIPMRSRLEATFAETTDRLGIEWLYEPRAYGAKGRRQYLPDFELRYKDSPVIYVEVRPTVEGAYLAMEQMSVIWDSEPEAILLITTPDGPWWTAYDDRFWSLFDMPWGWR